MVEMKRCDCGNKIDPRDLGDHATQCEWCETPEVPIYKINNLGDSVLLCWVGPFSDGVRLIHSDKLSVTAPSEASARLILDDYLASDLGNCDTCNALYEMSSRDGRCGDCGECKDHCYHEGDKNEQ